ncbi:helix-turn-helix domain-containing protein [Neobacillus mesonae]|uniref:helix-turn-helix domain-containing protein n=1 Tax=Neobacillus mesonae TaxID=1193713 RepID=UPI002E1FAD3C|nr:helix-turn-helix domain-containing protein [Neobacillus mesonae]MED4203519.1 helix-turn-helix domain-containing protein [Neobacillus mesonae]
MNQSVIMALSLLNFFIAGETDLTFSEVAERAKLPKPTVFRLLSSLEYMDFLSKSKQSDYDVRIGLFIRVPVTT